MVCVTLDVTDATTTTVPVMATSILLSVGVYLAVGSPSPSRGGESGRSGALPAVVQGTDSHWRDPWPNIALWSVPHAWHPCPGRSDVFAARCCQVYLGNS